MRILGGSIMNQTAMQIARKSFLQKHYLDKASLEVLASAKDLSNLLITVEAFDSVEQGTFSYNSETNEFYLYEQDEFFVRTRRLCSGKNKCPKNEWDTCLTRHSGEKRHSFERFLQMCRKPVYELAKITEK